MVDVPTYVEGFHDVEKVKLLKYSKLGNTDMVVSHIGIGGRAAGGEYGPVEEKESIATIVEAVKYGINFVDTSPSFGTSEEVIGKALRQLPRRSYYVSSKVGRYKDDWYEKFDFSPEQTVESVEKTLRVLGVDYLDLVQVHDLEFAVDLAQIVKDTLPALQRLVKQGKVRYLCITGYPLSALQRVLELSSLSSVPVDTVLSYCRNTLFDQALVNYIPYFQSCNVGIINASVTGMGLLTCKGPPHWHPAPQAIKDRAQQASQLCQERGVELACLAVRFSLMTPGIHTTVLGCDNVRMFRENFKLATEPLTEGELDLINEVKDIFSSLCLRHWEGVEIGEHFGSSNHPPKSSSSSLHNPVNAQPAAVVS